MKLSTPFLFVSMVFVAASTIVAQTPQFSILETGSASANTFPFSSVNIPIQLNYQPYQFIGAYRGNITKFYFKSASTTTTNAIYGNFTLDMAQPATYDFNAANTTYYTPRTTIYNGPLTIGPVTVDQWFSITLPTPVLYDPAKPLLIRLCNPTRTGAAINTRTRSVAVPPYHRIYNTNPLSSGCGAPLGYGIDGYMYPCGIDMVPACGIPNDSISVTITDAGGAPVTYANAPGTVYARLQLLYPPVGTSNVTLNLEFYKVGGSPSPAYMASFTTTKLSGIDLDQTFAVSLPGTLTPGYYRVKPIVNAINSCEEYEDKVLPEKVLMIIAPGQTPCLVWPGDVNNDGIVNYGDRGSLNMYIHAANLRTTWLQGPARYRADVATNPMTYLLWEEQPAVPWFTPEGCYMDADGNGFVNNFDYLGIKANFMRMHGGTAKFGSSFSATTFDMDQNYPNPFNPSTTIRFSSPERSHVRLVVHDMLGREVETLVNDVVGQGVQTVSFDASQLNSGNYVATIHIVGMESGLTFSKTIRMTLNK